MLTGKIISISKFSTWRGWGITIMASGGFDPLHPGHASYLTDAATLGDTLVVIVNGDGFLTKKKGQPFMLVEDRCKVVSCILYPGSRLCRPLRPVGPIL